MLLLNMTSYTDLVIRLRSSVLAEPIRSHDVREEIIDVMLL